VLGCALILAVVVIWSIKRHRDPRLRIECDAPFAELLPSLSALTHGVALEGNAVEILENGAFFEVMFEEIGRATRSVHFETCLWKDGRLGRWLVDALIERSRAGVTVRVLFDANGGKNMGEDAVRRLKEAGCKCSTPITRTACVTWVFSTKAMTARSSCWTAARPWSAATASSTRGSAMPRTASISATSRCGCAARSCMRSSGRRRRLP
jgi:hypothetical protein